jgi:methionine-rich copper-binding protein CopC
MKLFRQFALAVSTVLVLTTTAAAHAKLVSSTPAENTKVASPQAVTLVFNETLSADFSDVELLMLSMPGMDMTSPMAMDGITTALSDDKMTLVATPGKPLTSGRYRLNWHVVTSDTHRIEGSFEFDVQ